MADEADLLTRFENGKLGAGELTHENHVRLGWQYLERDALPDVLATLPARLRRFAADAGAPEIYNETMTWFFVLLIHDRKKSTSPRQSWTDFCESNQDLFTDWKGVLRRYYSDETLYSDVARTCFLLPDQILEPVLPGAVPT